MDSVRVFISITGSAINLVFSLLSFYLIRVIFDVDIVGLYGVILSFLSLFSFITDLGFSTAHLKIYPQAQDKKERGLCNSTFLSIRIIQFVLYSILILILMLFSDIYRYNQELILYFFISELIRIISYNLFIFFLLSKKQVTKKNIALIISSIVKLILFLVLSRFFQNNIWLLMNIFLISNIVLFITFIFFIIDLNWTFPNFEFIKKYFKFSYPFFAITALNIVVVNIDLLFVNIWFPIEEVANYFTSKQIMDFINIFLLNISYLILPIFSSNIHQNQNKKNLMMIKKLHKFSNIFLISIVTIIILYSNIVIRLFLGPEYLMTSLIISILSFSMIIKSNYYAIEIYLQSIEKVKLVAKIIIIQNLLSIIFMIFLISPDIFGFGAVGAAIAIVLANITTQLIFRPLLFKKYNLTFYWGIFRNLGIMTTILLLQITLNSFLKYSLIITPFFVIFDFFLFYFLNYLFKGLTVEDIKLIIYSFNPKNISRAINKEFKVKDNK